jgi:hypothetical protein
MFRENMLAMTCLLVVANVFVSAAADLSAKFVRASGVRKLESTGIYYRVLQEGWGEHVATPNASVTMRVKTKSLTEWREGDTAVTVRSTRC